MAMTAKQRALVVSKSGVDGTSRFATLRQTVKAMRGMRARGKKGAMIDHAARRFAQRSSHDGPD
jgi:hypothetical protein